MRCSLFVTCAVVLLGCNKTPEAPSAKVEPSQAAQPNKPTSKPASQPAKVGTKASAEAGDALDLYKKRCVTCHGVQGGGDGPAARALNPRPRSFADKTWQKSMTDAQIAAVTVKGGKAVGKSNMMPANPDLADKPKLTKALVALIRSFGP